MLLNKGSIDLVLVPSGLVIMFGYHLFLLYRILRCPHTTVIGYENHNKRAWVERMLQTASTNLASLSIALGSLIGTWAGGSTSKTLMAEVVYGRHEPVHGLREIHFLLVCFLAAFTCFIHPPDISTNSSTILVCAKKKEENLNYQKIVIRGGNFWSMGLRALYFATALLLWIFGPIPMFACSVFTVAVLHMLDSNSTPLHQFRFGANKAAGIVRRPTARPAPSNVLSNPVFSPPVSYLS
ncbi:hypothetical protein ACMD2_26732 [Ananas comosus]|uniref:Uncharacterized protein n=1 Tax=Ananas comosus TaxID=4615 RepID=A0A199UWR5_ANACO|nr:hypothetical protein ACMD2_26732 [Ananas comosus]